MDRRKKIIVNRYEALVHEVLSHVAQKNGCAVYPKVRLADAVDIDRSGLSNDAYSYALKSHFDFVVVDSQSVPEFAVEFDGPHHGTEPQQKRDDLKNQICERLGLPLLRIGADYVEHENESQKLLAWLSDLWFMSKAFDAAQASGSIPYDEPFGYAFSSFDYFRSYRTLLWKAHRDGHLRHAPMTFLHSFNADTGRFVACHLLELPNRSFVVGEAACAPSPLYPIDGLELASELALVDAANKFIRLQYRSYSSTPRAEAKATYVRYAAIANKHGLVYGCGSGPFPPET